MGEFQGRLRVERMALQLRGASRLACAARGFQTSAVNRGFYGLSPVKTDPAVEKWAGHREDIEETFQFTHKNSLRIGLFAVVLPVIAYALTTDEFREGDKERGVTSRGTK